MAASKRPKNIPRASFLSIPLKEQQFASVLNSNELIRRARGRRGHAVAPAIETLQRGGTVVFGNCGPVHDEGRRSVLRYTRTYGTHARTRTQSRTRTRYVSQQEYWAASLPLFVLISRCCRLFLPQFLTALMYCYTSNRRQKIDTTNFALTFRAGSCCTAA